jgi:cysteine-rich repeat protein
VGSAGWLVTLSVPALLGCSGTERLSLLSGAGDGSAETVGGSGGAGVSPPGAACGDGVLDPNESCDDGNSLDGDGCDASCRPSFDLAGAVGFRTTPLDTRVGANEDSARSVFFAEVLGLALPVEVEFDLHLPGVTGDFPAQRGALAPGALVNSYYFHYDVIEQNPAQVEFSVTFPTEVLAVIAADSALDASDAVFAVSAGYPTGVAIRGLDSNDRVELSSDRRRIHALVGVEDSVDSFRVLTRAEADQSLVASGQVAISPAPEGVVEGMAEGAALRLFHEQDVVLSQELAVDLWQPETRVSDGFRSGNVPAGQSVSCYVLHYDPLDTTDLVEAGGAVTFPRPILGVVAQAETLDASDGLGHGLTLYPTASDAARGLEPSSDELIILSDSKSLWLSFVANVGPDQIRVVTEGP